MRILGALVITMGIFIGGALCLVPTSFSVLGFDQSCGIPIINGLVPQQPQTDDVDQAMVDECVRRDRIRIFEALAAGAAGVILGVVILGAASLEDDERRRWQFGYRPAPQPYWPEQFSPPAVAPMPSPYAPPTMPVPPPQPQPVETAQPESSRPGGPAREPAPNRPRRRMPIWAVVTSAGLVLAIAVVGAFLVGRSHGKTINTAGAPSPTVAATTPVESGPSKSTDAPEFPTPPVGYGSVQIGMTVNALKRSDLVPAGTDWSAVAHPADGACAYVALVKPGAQAIVEGDIGRVVAIRFGPGMKTSHGYGVGSVLEDAARSVPGVTSEGYDGLRVPVAPGVHYLVSSGQHDDIADLILTWDRQACFG